MLHHLLSHLYSLQIQNDKHNTCDVTCQDGLKGHAGNMRLTPGLIRPELSVILRFELHALLLMIKTQAGRQFTDLLPVCCPCT